MAAALQQGLPDYEFSSRYVKVSDGTLHYVDEGSGPVLLFVHGNPTWSFLYRHVIRGLKHRFRCIALDHLGFGLSEKPEAADYTPLAHSNRLGEFIDALGLNRVTLVVQDWGGPIGLYWAVSNKERIDRLVVLNTVGFPFSSEYVSARRWGFYAAHQIAHNPILVRLLFQLTGLGVSGAIRWGVSDRRKITRQILAGYLLPFPNARSRRAPLALARAFPTRPDHPTQAFAVEIERGLRGWTVPVQLIWGARDRLLSPVLADHFCTLLPNHRQPVILEGASHFLQEEAPGPIVDAIEKFFESDRADGASSGLTTLSG